MIVLNVFPKNRAAIFYGTGPPHTRRYKTLLLEKEELSVRT